MSRAAVAGIALLALAGCARRQEPAAARPPADPVTVRLVAAEAAGLPVELLAQGVLHPQDELVAGFQVAGRLASLECDVGDAVAEGARIAALDSRDFELDVARAEAGVAHARARLGLAGRKDAAAPPEVDLAAPVREAAAILEEALLARDRMQQLVEQRLRPQSDLDVAVAAHAVALSRLQRSRDDVQTWIAELRSQEVALQVAQKRLADSVLTSPFSGRVATRAVTQGQYLAVGAPVVTLLRTDPLRLRMQLTDLVAAQVRTGQQVQFTVDGQGDRVHEGKVSRILPAIERESRAVTVEATVANPEGVLMPGGFARARIRVQERQPVVAVPRKAVVSFAGVDRVFGMRDGKAVEYVLELGRVFGDLVEVRSGLEVGAQLVAEPRGIVRGTPLKVAQ